MVIAFTGVLVIAFAEPMENALYEDMKHVGVACSLTVSVCYAIVAVSTRKMQNIHYAIVLWYYAILSVIVLSGILVTEALYK